MSRANFDNYVNEYRDIIDRVASFSGEKFEYFIQLRINMMKGILAQIPSSKDTVRIFDFGCGTGTTEIFLQDSFPRAAIYAVDSSVDSVLAARGIGLTGVTFIHSEGLRLPFPDGYFDVIYSNGTYHHIEPAEQRNFIAEMFRICKSGGNLFIFENNPKNPLMMKAMRDNPFDDGATALDPAHLREMATSAGFACQEIGYYFFFPHFLRALRCTEKWLRKSPLGAQYFLWATKTDN